MTDAEAIALGKRVVACKAWRWMPGMADQFGRRVMQVYPNELGFKWSHLLENNVVRDADALPDLTDPATLGCLLALVRELSGDPALYVCMDGGDPETGVWHVRWGNNCSRRGKTEGEALVNALIAIAKNL